MRSPRVLAVDAGASRVVAGIFTVGEAGRLVLQNFAIETWSADLALESRSAGSVAQALAAVARRLQVSGPCALAVPGHLAFTKGVKVSAAAAAKRDHVIAFEAAENIPHPLAEIIWDHIILRDAGPDLEVMFAAVKSDAMNALCTSAGGAALAVERAIPSCFALHHAFRHNYPEAGVNSLVANIGARSTTLLFNAGERFHVRTFMLAGNALTQAIADELRLAFDQAETLKLQVLSGRSELAADSPIRLTVVRAAAAFADRLQREIGRSLAHHRRETGAPLPTVLYLAGGSSLLPGWPETLADKMKLLVERYAPLRRVDLAADAHAAGAEQCAPFLADVIGLATRLMASGEREVSLLPPALAGAIVFRRRQPLRLAAATLAVVALLPPVFYFHRAATGASAEVARIEEQLAPLRARSTHNAAALVRLDAAKKQIAALRDVLEAKTSWLTLFADLQQRLVEVGDVWLDRLEVAGPQEPAALSAKISGVMPPLARSAKNHRGTAGSVQSTAISTATAPVVRRFVVGGRLLDVKNPESKVSADSRDRVKALLASFASSPFIAAVENEHFDDRQPGLLRFDFTLVLNPAKRL